MRLVKECVVCKTPLPVKVAEDGKGLEINGHLMTWQALRDVWSAPSADFPRGGWALPFDPGPCACDAAADEES